MSPTPPRSAWLSWIAVCVIWGTTYFAIKLALETIPPFLMGGMRYVVAGMLLASWLTYRGRALPQLSQWPRLAFLGFLMLGLGNGGVVWAQQYLASGLTAVIIATSPFWMVAVDALFPDGARLHLRQWSGLAIGFAGIVLLVWPDLVWSGGGAWPVFLGVLSLQIACLGWSVASSYTRRHGVATDVLGAAAVQMIFGGLALLAAGAVTGEWASLSFNRTTVSALVYLTIPGSLIGFAAYSHALRHLPIAVVSLYTYINPIIAVALGTLLLGETFRTSMLLSAALIVAGMFVVQPTGRARPGAVAPVLSTAAPGRRS